MSNNRRTLRNSALDLAAEAGPYTIIETIKLADTDPKFSAWITGARGRNGFRIETTNGTTHIVGLTTLRDLDERGAVTNFDAWTAPAPMPATIPTTVEPAAEVEPAERKSRAKK
jgi:hypothetical protein